MRQASQPVKGYKVLDVYMDRDIFHLYSPYITMPCGQNLHLQLVA